MKMSPWLRQGELEFGFAVVQRNPAVESLVQVDRGAREAEAAALGRDLEATACPLHDVVVTDHAGMNETADAVQMFRREAPSGEVSRAEKRSCSC